MTKVTIGEEFIWSLWFQRVRAHDGKGDGVAGRHLGQRLRNHIWDSRQEAESTMVTAHNF